MQANAGTLARRSMRKFVMQLQMTVATGHLLPSTHSRCSLARKLVLGRSPHSIVTHLETGAIQRAARVQSPTWGSTTAIDPC